MEGSEEAEVEVEEEVVSTGHWCVFLPNLESIPQNVGVNPKTPNQNTIYLGFWKVFKAEKICF